MNLHNVRQAYKILYEIRDLALRSRCIDLLRVIARRKMAKSNPLSIEVISQFVEHANLNRQAIDGQLNRMQEKIVNVSNIKGQFILPNFIREFHQQNSQELLNFYQIKNYFDDSHTYYWGKTLSSDQQTRAFNFVNNFLVASMSLSKRRLQGEWQKSKQRQKVLTGDLLTIGLQFEDLLSICSEEKDFAKKSHH